MVRGLWTFQFHLPQLHSAKIRFKWLIIWRRMKGWRDGARAAAAGFVPLCAVWITRNGEIASNKNGTGKGQWRVLFNSLMSLSFSLTPHVTQVSLPCSAANQVKSHSCQRGSQVGNVLFRAPYSQLRVDLGLQSHGTELPLNIRTSPEIEQAGCGTCRVEREKAVSEKVIWVLMKRWWMGLRPRQQ